MYYLHKNKNTLRILPRKKGTELRFNQKIFFANEDLTKIIDFVISSSDISKHDFLETGLSEDIILCALVSLSDEGISPEIWGEVWEGKIIKYINLHCQREKE
ncbi:MULTISPECIES: hypothetical protein [Xenorhabdus]|uniref:Uncharacterized protein n=1 Tax=Xenorhabdus koppenhoeferi TaxID=351659 RepID=A0A1I7H3S4_9GAMM|nr:MULTISPECIES: hypothetical protein [Xenorhabdus]MDC9594770.1 hypothetical protein [Xenorhabdus sp. IM139775]SFU55330.1 hypothetical protein SAMN05421784_11140 [Xenorhabdus koppenhoeferi]